jgi:hypothetical protein
MRHMQHMRQQADLQPEPAAQHARNPLLQMLQEACKSAVERSADHA